MATNRLTDNTKRRSQPFILQADSVTSSTRDHVKTTSQALRTTQIHTTSSHLRKEMKQVSLSSGIKNENRTTVSSGCSQHQLKMSERCETTAKTPANFDLKRLGSPSLRVSRIPTPRLERSSASLETIQSRKTFVDKTGKSSIASSKSSHSSATAEQQTSVQTVKRRSAQVPGDSFGKTTVTVTSSTRDRTSSNPRMNQSSYPSNRSK